MKDLKALEVTEEDLIDKVKFDHSISEIKTSYLRPNVAVLLEDYDLVMFRGRETRVIKDRYGNAGKVLPTERPSRSKPKKT
jgi:hypothetical protein